MSLTIILVLIFSGMFLLLMVGQLFNTCECFQGGGKFKSAWRCVPNTQTLHFFWNEDLQDEWSQLEALARAIDLQKRLNP